MSDFLHPFNLGSRVSHTRLSFFSQWEQEEYTRFGWMALVVLVSAVPAWAQEVTAEHDFRGSNFNLQLVSYAGANAAKFVKPEEDGLRFRFAAGDVPKEPVGIVWRTRVIGDFATTARYEVLENPVPKRGSGVGVELWLQLDNATRDGIAFGRLISPNQGPVFAFNHLTNNAEGKRVGKVRKGVPATEASKRGRLRLARVGNEVIASFAEGDEEQFTEVARTTIDDVDIRMARLAALPGGDPNATLDARILDFQLKGDLPGLDGVKLRSTKVAAGGPDALAPEGEPERGPRWVLLGSLLLVLGLGFTFGALFLIVRMRKAGAPKNASVEPKPESGASKVGVSCSACGQKIKVKESQVGKRVKCPACGSAVQVPAD